jgi:hypothetical protein
MLGTLSYHFICSNSYSLLVIRSVYYLLVFSFANVLFSLPHCCFLKAHDPNKRPTTDALLEVSLLKRCLLLNFGFTDSHSHFHSHSRSYSSFTRYLTDVVICRR